MLVLLELSGVVLSTGALLPVVPGATEPTGTESPMGVLESVVGLPILLGSRGVTPGAGTELPVVPGVADPMRMEGVLERAVGLPAPSKALTDIDAVP